jgi:quercetin dioxygenase-like cupin family protein
MKGLRLSEVLRQHPTARRLGLSVDPAPLVADLDRFDDQWWHRHAGPYHDGAWESVSLWSPRGDPFEQRSKGGTFAATPALAVAPAIRQVMDLFPCDRNRIRLMRLRPGGRILRHSDPLHTIDPRLVRLHVPIVTNPDVWFSVNDQRVEMRPGEVWHVDVRFPHAVENRGASTRVHLVLDLVRNPDIDQWLSDGAPAGQGRLFGYYAVHSLPSSVRQFLGLGN